jgi:molybdate transport system substrate-binding protein
MAQENPRITILSAGAIEPGLVEATQTFGREQQCEVAIEWATTPMIRSRIAGGQTADLLVVPPAAFDDFVAAGYVPAGSGVTLGRVGVGVGVRTGAPLPDITTTAALTQSLLDFESIVINRASSGLYMEGLLERLGVKDRIAHKLVRIIDGPQMMQHIIHGKGREFAFCASIEIVLYRDRGVTLVGMLPEDIQHYTTYVAAPMHGVRDDAHAEAVKALLAYFDSPPSRGIFARHGITIDNLGSD